MNATIKQLVTVNPSTGEKVYHVELWVDGNRKYNVPANGSHHAAIIAGQLLANNAGATMVWG